MIVYPHDTPYREPMVRNNNHRTTIHRVSHEQGSEFPLRELPNNITFLEIYIMHVNYLL